MTATKKPKFKSDAFEAVHDAAHGMLRAGVIGKATMREFDESCLAPVKRYKASQIKQIRQRNNVSQPIFARYLNTSESTVEKWETGAKQPSGMALKLLSVVEKHGIKVLT
jgi:putative transcriptional regulator